MNESLTGFERYEVEQLMTEFSINAKFYNQIILNFIIIKQNKWQLQVSCL